MSDGDALSAVLERLVGEGWEEVEVFHKRGRSRTLTYAPGHEIAAFHQEEGWAVRAGDRRRSFFYAATGAPAAGERFPEGDGRGLRLPSARPVLRWTPPSTLDVPLVGESEAHGLFEALGRELDRELPGARLIAGALEDGSSESRLLSSREVAATVRHRAAALRLEAAGPRGTTTSVGLALVDRNVRRFSPAALARRLADRLLIAERGTAPARDRGDFLLAPDVVIGLLEALAPLWLGPAASAKAAELTDRRGRLGSTALTLIDNGRLPGGVLEAPVDGEGQPTREVVVVEEGGFRQPLLAWWQGGSGPQRVSGCCLRPGWRDLPRHSPTHFYLRPDESTSVASLLASLSRGYYLLALDGPPRLEDDLRRFAAPVSGFAIDAGRAVGSVRRAWLTGSVAAFLSGVLAVGRDLTFLPGLSGVVGAPSVLARGLELRQPP